MCEHLDKRTSFRLSQVTHAIMPPVFAFVLFDVEINRFGAYCFQIEDGDIICFQKSPPPESEEECKYPDVPSFLEYVHNRQVPSDVIFFLTLVLS